MSGERAAPVRAVLWDLDGTLVESAHLHWQAWNETLEAEGVDVTFAQFRETFGQRNDAILGRWLGPDAEPSHIRRLGDAKEARYRRIISDGGIEPLPGAARWIHALAAAGWRQAVASSAPKLNVEVVIEALGLREQFGALVAAEDVRLGKPEPEVFLAAADRLGASPARCVVVEDAVAGIEAARRAGMKSVGIGPAGFADSDIVVRSLEDLALDAFDQLLEP